MTVPDSQAHGSLSSYEPTGHRGADRALQDLENLQAAPVNEHAAAYQAAHARLSEVLDAPVNALAALGGESAGEN